MGKVEKFIKALMATRDVLRLYAGTHPEFIAASKKAFAALQDIFHDEHEVVVGIVGDEFTFKNEIFFSLSERLRLVIEDLKQRGIERLAFSRGVEQEELNKFVSLLLAPEEEYGDDIHDVCIRHGIRHITVGTIKAATTIPSLNAKDIDDPLARSEQYEQSIDVVSESIENVLDEKVIDYQNLKFTINNVKLNLMEQ